VIELAEASFQYTLPGSTHSESLLDSIRSFIRSRRSRSHQDSSADQVKERDQRLADRKARSKWEIFNADHAAYKETLIRARLQISQAWDLLSQSSANGRSFVPGRTAFGDLKSLVRKILDEAIPCASEYAEHDWKEILLDEFDATRTSRQRLDTDSSDFLLVLLSVIENYRVLCDSQRICGMMQESFTADRQLRWAQAYTFALGSSLVYKPGP
jgi:hypothetical protein